MSNANNMAFPVVLETTRTPNDSEQLGLTKRELFALKTMQGLLANSSGPIQANGMNGWGLVNCTWSQVAGAAVRAGDALLAELAKRGDFTNEQS